MTAIDLDAYFERIHFHGTPKVDMATVRALHRLHPDAIVFEAIDVLLGRGIDLAPAAVDAKLIGSGRGGYCFEHNGLFKRVLEVIGFDVEARAARVLWKRSPDAPQPSYSHMVLQVCVAGRTWLADVGFGGRVPTAPLETGSSAAQDTGHDTFRLLRDAPYERLEARVDDGWAPVYELSDAPWVEADFEQANWFTSTHPDSTFRRDLIVARTTADARYALLRNRYTVRPLQGSPRRRTLNADQIEAVLGGTFSLPVEPAWREIIERAAAA